MRVTHEANGPRAEGPAGGQTPAIEVVDVSKRFEATRALNHVSMTLYPGEVHGLVGENGAGKSTLVKILAGAHKADEGTVRRNGELLELSSPKDAIAAGVAVVYQELTVLPYMTVEENLMLGREPRTSIGWLRRRESRETVRRYLDIVGGDIDPRWTVDRLSIAQRQLLEIARALSLDAEILLLDEPTSSLSMHEVEHLRGVIDRLRNSGVAVVLISHDLREVFQIAQRVTVLKDGEVTLSGPIAGTSLDEVLRKMVGRDMKHMFPERVPPPPDARVVLEARNLTVPGQFEDVSFELRAGTVTGFIGLIGAGRSEVAKALVGVGRHSAGQVLLDGRPIRFRHPSQAINAGIGIVPEERQAEGLMLGDSIAHNIALPQLRALSRWGVMSRSREARVARDQIRALKIKAPGPRSPVGALSGGNQQKVVLAKWLAKGCRLLILDEPTRGIDVNAKADIYDLIRRLAAEGTAVMLISSEMPEALHLSDRLVVMAHGRVTADIENSGTDERGLANEEAIIRSALNLGEDEPVDDVAAGTPPPPIDDAMRGTM
jgi:ABC-type sugar transport system ATPase subunit